MATKNYKNKAGNSPIKSYNVIRSQQKGKYDKVVVYYGRENRSTKYTYTALELGKPGFEALVGALEDGIGAARHINSNIDAGSQPYGSGRSKSYKDRHSQRRRVK